MKTGRGERETIGLKQTPISDSGTLESIVPPEGGW